MSQVDALHEITPERIASFSAAKTGLFTFVSTKLASTRAIKLSRINSRRFFQSFATKSISRVASQADALREITPERRHDEPRLP